MGHCPPGRELALGLAIKSKLTGNAKQVISARNLTSWFDIRPVLIEYFGDRRDLESLARDLSNISQKNDENYKNYVQRIEKALSSIRNVISVNSSHTQAEKEVLLNSYERIG